MDNFGKVLKLKISEPVGYNIFKKKIDFMKGNYFMDKM